jgi:hypothetical protein
MTPIINPTWKPAIRAADMWMHPDVEDGTYIAKKDDKFVLWRNYEELEELLKYIEFHTNTPTDFSTQQWSNLMPIVNAIRFVSMNAHYLQNYIEFTKQHFQTPPCQIVPSAVDGVTYNTKVRIFTPNVPHTHLGRSWYPQLHLHMYLYNDGPQQHPVYGEHIGWTAAIIMLN